jgi:membrane-bound inhibitor of C-type lysozyme
MKVFSRVLSGGVVLLAVASVEAGSLQVPRIQVSAPATHSYRCDGGKSLQVTYWNGSNGQSFALLPVQGKALLFVSTLAASGVKYDAGQYTWWTKGNHGDLYDLIAGPNAPPIIAGCTGGTSK